MKRPLLLLFGAVFAASATTAATAQSDSSAAPAPVRAIYSAEQATRGKELHTEHCVTCHEAEAYTGDAFRSAWGGRTAYDFFDLLRTTMPNDNPGILKREEYVAIVAYVLSLNGIPAGTDSLPHEDEPLKTVKIELPAAAVGLSLLPATAPAAPAARRAAAPRTR